MRYIELANLYSLLEKSDKRLAKTYLLADLIKKTGPDELSRIMPLLEGKVFPGWDERKIGVAQKLVMKALSVAFGISQDEVMASLKETGDLGLAAELLLKKKKQHTLGKQTLTVTKVFENIKRLAELQGEGSASQKVQLVAELLTSAEPGEAKYIVRTILEDLRVGTGEGAMRDAIVWALFGEELGLTYDHEKNELVFADGSRERYSRHVEAVEDAYNTLCDFGKVAQLMKEKGLVDAPVSPGTPLNAMLFQKAESIEQAFLIVGKPAALEYKYDGFRIQIHKDEQGTIKLFTRRLEEVTEQFPDVIEYVKRYVSGRTFILDAEAVGHKPGRDAYLPFQAISQRIKRKYDIKKTALQFPVEVNVFDIIFYDGESLMPRPFSERRAILSRIIDPHPRKIIPSTLKLSDDPEEAMRFYNESLDRGNEGMMAKSITAAYKPGKRVGFGVKIKPVMDSLDLVIVGAEWGEGERAGCLTSYILACRENNEFHRVGRVSTGLKELADEGTTFQEMTELLKPLIRSEKDKVAEIMPQIVIEVHYEEIQASPTYDSGFALRFPRFIRLRTDRGPRDIDTLDTIKSLYTKQRSRNK